MSSPSTVQQEYFQTTDAARFLGCAGQTLRRWRVEGIGPIYSVIARRCYYRRGDLVEFMEASLRRSTKDVEAQ
jgi:hypothetical protein